MKDNIELESYDPGWREKATEEIVRLKKTFDGLGVGDIQHIESTAIPGLAAKPIIDLMVGVAKIEDGKSLIPVLENMGYVFWADNPKKDRLFFVKGMPPFGEKRTHHVHVFTTNHYEWHARQLFRDYLCTHPEERKSYDRLKQQLAAQHSEDREAYTAAKTDFVQRIVHKALGPCLTFVPLAEAHFPLLLKWLETPHVKDWWDADVQWTPALICEKYGPYVKGYKQEAGIFKPISAFIMCVNETPVGYFQGYNAYDFPRAKPLTGLPQQLAAFDILIGEESFLKHGIGSLALTLFFEKYLDLSYTHIFADPDEKNKAAIRTYEKAGFERLPAQPVAGEVWMLRKNARSR